MQGLLPIHINAFRMTDEEFVRFCEDNPELRIERTSQKEIIIMSPDFPFSSAINGEIYSAVYTWNKRHNAGRVFDSSAGFFLPDGSLRAPDVAWIPQKEWKQLVVESKRSFLKYCPDFVVEVKSQSDRLKDLNKKMEDWMTNGCKLAWLIDPEMEKTRIYYADKPAKEVSGFDSVLSGEEVLQGFTLTLSELRLD
jgi:Uma2 family endonuclease